MASIKRLRSSSEQADNCSKATAAASPASSTVLPCPFTTRPLAALTCPLPVSSLRTLRTMRSSSASLICSAISSAFYRLTPLLLPRALCRHFCWVRQALFCSRRYAHPPPGARSHPPRQLRPHGQPPQLRLPLPPRLP